MARPKKPPPVVDDLDDAQRSAIERRLLSLLGGFKRLHNLSEAEFCEVMLECADWIACPSYASRVFLAGDQVEADKPVLRKRGVS